MKLRNTANLWFPFLLILLIIGLTFFNLSLQEKIQSYDDFSPRYTAARLWLRSGLSPYSDQVIAESRALQSDYGFTASEFDQGTFIEPPIYLFLYMPLTFLPFATARAIWMAVVELSYLFSAVLALRLSGYRVNFWEAAALVLFSFIWYPTFKLILTASILPPFIAIALLGTYLGIKGEGTASAVLLFVCSGVLPISFPLAILMIILFSLKRDSSMARLYLIGMVFLVVISLILFPGWIAEWSAHFINLHPQLDWVDTPLMRLAKIFPAAARPVSLILHGLTLLALLIEWYGLGHMDERSLRFKIMLTFLLFYLFNLTSHGAYLLLLLPALFLSFRFLSEKWRLFGKILNWVIYLTLIFFYWRRFSDLGTWVQKEPSFVVLLLPVIALTGLEWFRWWATKSPKAKVDLKS